MSCRIAVGLVGGFLVGTLLSPPAHAQSSVNEFRLGGSAVVLDDECIRLTPDGPYTTGSAWFERPVDLSEPFEVRMSIVLGDKDREGADGIVFVFHPEMSTGFRGEGMGFSGLVPSLGIEFDTYPNLHLNDPAGDHLALMVNGQRYHGIDSTEPVALGNLEDDARHPLRIRWNPKAGSLKVVLDNRAIATFGADVVHSLFGADAVVYWGMTAATGRLHNAQDICIERMLLSRSENASRQG
ncbi:MAG: L-type lectin-domain containing protein [Myxococcota bacterium]